MSKSYGRMVSFNDAIAWLKQMDVPEDESLTKEWVLNRLRYERDQNVPVPVRIRKGRIFDENICGNCGFLVDVGIEFCPKCGFALKWPR